MRVQQDTLLIHLITREYIELHEMSADDIRLHEHTWSYIFRLWRFAKGFQAYEITW